LRINIKFATMEFSSKLLENAVNEISQLPGIGKRTALRLALHLLKQPKEQTNNLSQALSAMRQDLKLMMLFVWLKTLEMLWL